VYASDHTWTKSPNSHNEGVNVDGVDWRNLLDIKLHGWGLDAHVGIVLICLLIALVLTSVLLRQRGGSTWRMTKANFSFAGCGQVEICPTNDVARIAHDAWVELRSRKAAIPFDSEYDVIVEIYNSWYELFRALRELAKSIPPESVRARGDAPMLADVLLSALNDGLRPHLTRWQARFRRWYDKALADSRNANKSPQEIQRQFPEYEALIADLHRVNAGMIEFTNELGRIAHERTRRLSIWRRGSMPNQRPAA
jgi:hypothetical protein